MRREVEVVGAAEGRRVDARPLLQIAREEVLDHRRDASAADGPAAALDVHLQDVAHRGRGGETMLWVLGERRANDRLQLAGGALHVEDGRPTGTPPPFHIAQVNHYALRSMEAFLIKRARGRANHMHHVLGMEYWERFDFGGEEDLSIRRYDPLRDEWMQRFREDEKLWALHRKSVRWHRWKARELRKDPAANALRLEILARFAAGQSQTG